MPPQPVKQKKYGTTLTKQDCECGDTTASIRLVLWESNVGRLRKNSSYKLSAVTVSTYNGVQYLSFGKNSILEEISDIGEVEGDEEDHEGVTPAQVGRRTVTGDISGVNLCNEYKSCIVCNSKVTPVSDLLGECGKCSMLLKLDKCNMASLAKIVVITESGTMHTITMFNDMITKLIEDVPSTTDTTLAMKILSAGPHQYFIDHRNVVCAIQKL